MNCIYSDNINSRFVVLCVAGRKYLCLPSMDRCMPEPRELGDFALRVSKLSTPTYIHCANG